MVSAVTSVQLDRAGVKEAARQLVDGYFGATRRDLALSGITDEQLAGLDATMHDLLALAQRKSLTRRYREVMGALRGHLNKLESAVVGGAAGGEGNDQQKDAQDGRIVATLEQMSPVAAASYAQALLDLSDRARLSWRGTAAELREALREAVDKLAPDSEVEAQPGYVPQKDANGPTMSQKVQFILRSRGKTKAAVGAAADTVASIEERVGKCVRSIYTRSSASTHGRADREEVLAIKRYVSAVLAELLETGG
jgi:uncharacterized protein YidB (DUF937 family)